MSKTQDVRDMFRVLMAANKPTILVSHPGAGKTAMVEDFGHAQGWTVVTRILATMDPTDVGGGRIVVEDDDGRVYGLIAPEEVALLNRGCEETGGALFFLDEFNTAPLSVQATAHRILNEREMGGIPLDSRVRIALAVNPPESATGAYPVRPAAANRLAWLQWTPSPEEWAEAQLIGWPSMEALNVDSERYAEARAEIAYLVSDFIRAQGIEALHKLPPDESAQGGPWPSPRSWDWAIDAAATARAVGMSQLELPLMMSLVGMPVMREYDAYASTADLPNPEDLLATPKLFTVPDRLDKLFTIIGAVVGAVLRNPSDERAEAAWTILGEVAAQGKTGAAAACARKLAQLEQYPVPRDVARAFVSILQRAGDL